MKKLFILNIGLIFIFCAVLAAKYTVDKEETEKWKMCYKILTECKKQCGEMYVRDVKRRIKCRSQCRKDFDECTYNNDNIFDK